MGCSEWGAGVSKGRILDGSQHLGLSSWATARHWDEKTRRGNGLGIGHGKFCSGPDVTEQTSK